MTVTSYVNDARQKLAREWNIVTDANSKRKDKQVSMQVIINEMKKVNINETTELEWIVIPCCKIMLEEPVESIRTQAISLLKNVYSENTSEEIDRFSGLIINSISERFTKEISEEIRLDLLQFLRILIERMKATSPEKMETIIFMMKNGSNDQFHDCRKEAFNCIIEICKKYGGLMKSRVEELVSIVGMSIGHRHSNVRAAAIKALGYLLMSNVDFLKDVSDNFFKKCLIDSSSAVRYSLYETMGLLALEHSHRFAIMNFVLPYLICGTADSISKHVEFSNECLNKVSKMIAEEFKEQLRGQTDYLPNAESKDVGLEYVYRDNLYKIINQFVVPDLQHWIIGIREKMLDILINILPVVESHITSYSLQLFSLLWKTFQSGLCKDKVKQIFSLFGKYVSSEIASSTWLDVYFKQGVAFTYESFIQWIELAVELFSAFPPTNFSMTPLLEFLTSNFKEFQIQEKDFSLVTKLLSLLLTFSTDSQSLFNVCITCYFIPEIQSKMSFFEQSQIDSLSLDYVESNIGSSNFAFYKSLPLIISMASEKSPVFAEIKRLLISAVKAASDDRVKFYIIYVLASLLPRYSFDESDGKEICNDIICPLLVWKPGKAFAENRSCVLKFLAENFSLFSNYYSPQFWSLIVSCLDEDFINVKTAALSVIPVALSVWKECDLLVLYPELLKRFEDPSDDIRISSSKSINAFLPCSLSEVHIEAIIDALLIHIDDSNPNVQNAMFDTLCNIKKFHQEIAVQKVQAALPKLHRSGSLLENF